MIVRLRIAPVPATAVRLWTTQMLENLGRLRQSIDRLPFLLPDEVSDTFESLLRQWRAEADQADPFEWSTEMDPVELARLVQYWANLDSLTDAQVEALGVSWSSAGARPFFDALADAVAEALEGEGMAGGFAKLLVESGRHPKRQAPPDPCGAFGSGG